MSLKFPVIDSKKSLASQQDDYNFVNKDKKKKPSTSGQSLQMIEDLKRKIDEQKKQIQNRNITIQGLQRNFESLSLIVKNQKATSSALRQQLQNFKRNQSSNDQRATQYHQKYLIVSNQIKKLKEDHQKFKKLHLNCGQYLVVSQRLKNQIITWQQKYQKLLNKLTEVDSDKNYLKQELNKYKSLQQERLKQVKINQRLKQQIEKQKQASKSHLSIVLTKDQQISRINSQLIDKQRIIALSQQKTQKLNQKLLILQKQIQRFESMLQQKNKQHQQMKKMSQNKQLFNKLKIQDEQKLKRQLNVVNKRLQQKTKQLQQTSKQLQKTQQSLDHKEQLLIETTLDINRQKTAHQQTINQFNEKQKQYLQQLQKIKLQTKQLSQFIQKLTGQKYMLEKQKQSDSSSYGDKVTQLNRELMEISTNMGDLQRKYGNYLKLIDENSKKGKVVITTDIEINGYVAQQHMLSNQLIQVRKQLSSLQQKSQIQTSYIKSLQSQVNSKGQQIINLTKRLHKYQLQQSELNKILSNEKSKSTTLEQQKLQYKEELQEKLREKQYQLEKQRRQKQEIRLKQELKEKALLEYKQKLSQYQRQQQQLKQLMQKQKHSIQQLKRQKQLQIQQLMKQKQQQIQKQKNNNKVLWQDNKKLKQYEDSLKKQAQRQLQDIENMKQVQMQRMRRQMQSRMISLKMSQEKQSESSSNELKKILLQKSNQMKIITQNYNQLQTQNSKIKKQLTKFLQQAQFYKNRNKQLQGLLDRIQKTYKQKLYEADKQCKSYKQVVSVYEKKEKKAIKEREEMQENKKNVENELFKLKRKYQGQKIEEKLALIRNTITDFQLSLKTLLNTFSCNYCVEVVQDCIRLQQCGHIYCKKCKAGYEPNCGQCKTKSKAKPDKNINESVSKAQYMKILLNTIKDDIQKINL